MEFFCCLVVSNHNFACTKEHHRIAQQGPTCYCQPLWPVWQLCSWRMWQMCNMDSLASQSCSMSPAPQPPPAWPQPPSATWQTPPWSPAAREGRGTSWWTASWERLARLILRGQGGRKYNEHSTHFSPFSSFDDEADSLPSVESGAEDPAKSDRDGRFLLYWLTTTSTSTTTIYTGTSTLGSLECTPNGYTVSLCG